MGEPRIFEIETLTGIGWLHYYQNGPGDTNSWSTRLGLNLKAVITQTVFMPS